VIEGCSHFLSLAQAASAGGAFRPTRQVHETRPWLHWDKRMSSLSRRGRARRVWCAGHTIRTYLSFRFTGREIFHARRCRYFRKRGLILRFVMQSRVHEIWARCQRRHAEKGTSGTVRRTHSSLSLCFLSCGLTNSRFCGVAYHTLRDEVMKRLGVGPTAVYTRFHDPEETDPDSFELRDLHAAMDRPSLMPTLG